MRRRWKVALLGMLCLFSLIASFWLLTRATAVSADPGTDGAALLIVSDPSVGVRMRVEVEGSDRVSYSLTFFGQPEPEDDFPPLKWVLWLEGDAKFADLDSPGLYVGDNEAVIEIEAPGLSSPGQPTERVQIVQGDAAGYDRSQFVAGQVVGSFVNAEGGSIAWSLPLFGTDTFARLGVEADVFELGKYDGLPEGDWFLPSTFRVDVNLGELGAGQRLDRAIPETVGSGTLRWIDEVAVQPRATITDLGLQSRKQRDLFLAGALVAIAGGLIVEILLEFFAGVPRLLQARRHRLSAIAPGSACELSEGQQEAGNGTHEEEE